MPMHRLCDVDLPARHGCISRDRPAAATLSTDRTTHSEAKILVQSHSHISASGQQFPVKVHRIVCSMKSVLLERPLCDRKIPL